MKRRSFLHAGAAATTAATLALGDGPAARAQTAGALAPWPFEIFDVHVHAGLVWFSPVETLIAEMDRAGVRYGALTQFFGQYDNEYLFQIVRRFPGRFSIIVHLDGTRPDAPQTLKAYADRGATGVRLNPTVRSPGSDPLAIWKAAAQYGMSLSVLGGPPASLATDEFAQLIQTIPQTPIVLEHQAGDYNIGESSAGYSSDYASLDDVKKAFALARFPNVYVMIGGLAEFTKPALPTTRPLPFAQPISPVIDMAYDAFGPSRMMWGSDFPASARREGYVNSLREAMDYLSTKPVQERALIFGGTGRTVFPIKSA